jgi:hypothetical protein
MFTLLTYFRPKKSILAQVYTMTDLSTIFGKPGEGIQQHYCGIAVADVAMTGAAAVLIAKVFNKSFLGTFAALIALGIGAHLIILPIIIWSHATQSED